jgi:hypothetical protein
MKTHKLHHSIIAAAALTLAFTATASAKDETVTIDQCPPPVQAILRSYQTQGQLEVIGLDKKKKSGGPAVYEAKFTLAGGRRIELHLSPNGSILQIEEKRRKD